MVLVGRESRGVCRIFKAILSCLEDSKGFERHKSVGNWGFKGLRLLTMVEQKMFTNEMPTDQLPYDVGACPGLSGG